MIGHVDCTAGDNINKELCNSHGVNGFPTLNIYKDGVKVIKIFPLLLSCYPIIVKTVFRPRSIVAREISPSCRTSWRSIYQPRLWRRKPRTSCNILVILGSDMLCVHCLTDSLTVSQVLLHFHNNCDIINLYHVTWSNVLHYVLYRYRATIIINKTKYPFLSLSFHLVQRPLWFYDGFYSSINWQDWVAFKAAGCTYFPNSGWL